MIPRLRQLWDTPAVLLLVPLAVSIAVAASMTFWIEQPALRAVRGLYSRVRERKIQCRIPTGKTS
jgi:peptidoglycan/LPS O-acetylase OafA/YrhL